MRAKTKQLVTAGVLFLLGVGAATPTVIAGLASSPLGVKSAEILAGLGSCPLGLTP